MVPLSKDEDGEAKHFLKQVGKKYVFTIKNLNPEDAGIYQVDVEGVNIFSTDFKSTFSVTEPMDLNSILNSSLASTWDSWFSFRFSVCFIQSPL